MKIKKKGAHKVHPAMNLFRTGKQGFAVILILAIMFVTVGSGYTVYAENPNEEAGPVTNIENDMQSDVSVTGSNSFGALLAESIDEERQEQQENDGYNIFSIEMLDKDATVSFEAGEDCTLVVGIYDEAGNKMLASGSMEVSADETEAIVPIETDEMPEYFYIKGFLVDTDNYNPLCTVYESPNYTREMQEFFQKTTADFNEEKVINFDDDENNNFAVCEDTTKVIPVSEGLNFLQKWSIKI